eukprot:746522-Hanusia_phi.AAC.1
MAEKLRPVMITEGQYLTRKGQIQRMQQCQSVLHLPPSPPPLLQPLIVPCRFPRRPDVLHSVGLASVHAERQGPRAAYQGTGSSRRRDSRGRKGGIPNESMEGGGGDDRKQAGKALNCCYSVWESSVSSTSQKCSRRESRARRRYIDADGLLTSSQRRR